MVGAELLERFRVAREAMVSRFVWSGLVIVGRTLKVHERLRLVNSRSFLLLLVVLGVSNQFMIDIVLLLNSWLGFFQFKLILTNLSFQSLNDLLTHFINRIKASNLFFANLNDFLHLSHFLLFLIANLNLLIELSLQILYFYLHFLFMIITLLNFLSEDHAFIVLLTRHLIELVSLLHEKVYLFHGFLKSFRDLFFFLN